MYFRTLYIKSHVKLVHVYQIVHSSKPNINKIQNCSLKDAVTEIAWSLWHFYTKKDFSTL